MLDTLAAEIIILILSYITTIPDFLSLRLASRGLANYVEPHLFNLAFKTIRLPLNDIGCLHRAIFHIGHSRFAKNIRWIVIGASGYGDNIVGELVEAGQGTAQDSDAERSHELVAIILTRLAAIPRVRAVEEILVDFGMRDIYEDDQQLASTSLTGTPYFSFPGQPRSDRPFGMAILTHDISISLDILSRCTMKILDLWYRSHLRITSLELDNAVLALRELGKLAHIIAALPGIKRLTLRLCQGSVESVMTSIPDSTRNMHELATALHDHLEQLVISSTCTTGGALTQNFFLESFMEYAVFPRLQYLYLDGFSLPFTLLLRFLERHRDTLVQHGYSKFYFNGLNDLDPEEFDMAFNEAMHVRGMSHLQIISCDSSSD